MDEVLCVHISQALTSVSNNSATAMSGAMLASTPRPRGLHFRCIICSSQVYDGGLGKISVCECGSVQCRLDDDTVIATEAPNPMEFSSLFSICNNRLPPNFEVMELKSLSLGVYSESINARLRANGDIDHSRVMTECAFPYFAEIQRCVGLNDFIDTPDASFKVVGCQPSFGVVGRNTQLMINQTLHCTALERIHILPTQPHAISDDFVQASLLPYLRSGPIHLHTGQLLVLQQIVCVVIAASPEDGLVTSSTQVFTQGEPLASLADLHLAASLESLPPVLRSVSSRQLKWALLNLFIAPHYRGRMRTALQGYRMVLEGVAFKVTRCWPQYGLVTEHTRITCEISIVASSIVRMIDPNTGQLVSMVVMPGSIPQQPRGVTPDVLAALPERQLASVPTSEDNKRCMVCLEDFEVGSKVKTLPCCKF